MNNIPIQKREFRLLQFLTFAVFAGRAYQHIFWDIPIRTLMWDEGLLGGVVERWTDMSWQEYVTSMEMDAWLQNIAMGLGWFCLLCAVLVWLFNANRRWMGWILRAGGVYLILLFLLYWKEKFHSAGMFIEHTLQWGTPFMLVWAVLYPYNTNRFRFWLKVAIALTFIGHGLYAFGYYPVPGNFTDMMVMTFGMSDAMALFWLKVAGVLDFIAAAALFIPRLVKPALIYCIIWGFITAFARIVANFSFDMPVDSLYQWWHETFFRLPHGGIPLLVYWLLKDRFAERRETIRKAH